MEVFAMNKLKTVKFLFVQTVIELRRHMRVLNTHQCGPEDMLSTNEEA